MTAALPLAPPVQRAPVTHTRRLTMLRTVPGGAIATYTAPTGSTCTLASGSLFAPGPNTVTCTKDSNPSITCTFTIQASLGACRVPAWQFASLHNPTFTMMLPCPQVNSNAGFGSLSILRGATETYLTPFSVSTSTFSTMTTSSGLLTLALKFQDSSYIDDHQVSVRWPGMAEGQYLSCGNVTTDSSEELEGVRWKNCTRAASQLGLASNPGETRGALNA